MTNMCFARWMKDQCKDGVTCDIYDPNADPLKDFPHEPERWNDSGFPIDIGPQPVFQSDSFNAYICKHCGQVYAVKEG